MTSGVFGGVTLWVDGQSVAKRNHMFAQGSGVLLSHDLPDGSRIEVVSTVRGIGTWGTNLSLRVNGQIIDVLRL